MLKFVLSFLVCVSGQGVPFFKDANQLEIRKYRFSRHSNKGFERLVLEFDHLSGDGKPELKVEMNKNEASITILQARLSGIIPESEINHSYLTKSRFLGPVAISAQKESFHLSASFKKHSSVEAFWLDKPARLVVDVFPASQANQEASTAKRTLAMQRLSRRNLDEVFCFPAQTQLQASVAFGKKAPPIEGSSGTEGETLQNDVVCFPKDARLTPLITFKAAPYPMPNSVPQAATIQTDPVGGSQLIGPTTGVENTMPVPLAEIPTVPTAYPGLIAPVLTLPVPEVAALPNAANIPRYPSSVTSSIPGPAVVPLIPTPMEEETLLTDPTEVKDFPATPAEVMAPQAPQAADAGEIAEQTSDPSTPFPVVKKKKKKKKPRLPQLPLSITEGALLPPIK